MTANLENDLNAIKGAKNEDELKKVYALAVATHRPNRGNLEAIVEAKNIRKGELGRSGSKPPITKPVSGTDVPS